jgi:AraC family transcriptional regulator
LGGLLITDAWFPPDLVLKPHTHDRTVLAVTLAGSWDSVIDRRPRVSEVGMVLTEPAGESHANHFAGGGARVLVMQPDPARIEALADSGRFLERVNHFPAATALGLARRLSIEMQYQDSATPLAVEGLGLELLVAAARVCEGRRRSRQPQWLRRVVDLVHTDFLHRFTLAELAAIASVHPAHLAREFRRHHHMSISSYLRRLRLDWASEQLVSSERSAADIAAAAGFADQSHFTRAFRRHTGLPPHGFRQAHGWRRKETTSIASRRSAEPTPHDGQERHSRRPL